MAGWLQEVDGGPQPLAASAWGWEVGGLWWAWPVLSLQGAHSLPLLQNPPLPSGGKAATERTEPQEMREMRAKGRE